MSKLGYCSRSNATKLIRAGRVTLNGTIRRDPETPVLAEQDEIAADGKAIVAQNKIYIMLNKPRGVVTTASDQRGRDTVYTVLNSDSARGAGKPDESFPWVAPVGRLDKASEGLLLLTNDSEWAARIASPRTHLDKIYHVQVGTVADDNFIKNLVAGVQPNDGEVLRAKRVRLLRSGQKNCWVEIVLDEGKNRQIRRMMEALGVEVLRLIRVAIGPLRLGDLAKGRHRALTADEQRMLNHALHRTL